MPAKRGVSTAKWDTVKGRKLWDQGKTPAEIAKEAGTTRYAVIRYGERHWPARQVDADRHAAAFGPDRHKRPPPAPRAPRSTLPPLPSLST